LKRWPALAGSLALLAAISLTACGGDDEETLTVYSGRNENLVGPLLEQFSDETGIRIRVQYADTASLAATILEEGGNSPADVYFAQDAGALGALNAEGRLVQLPNELLDLVPEAYRSPDGSWTGVSGRARVVVYNTGNVSQEELPESILEFTEADWDGRIGWAPTNGSFQAFVTGLRRIEGEDAARDWLDGIQANGPTEYPDNNAALEGVIQGEVDVAFINHYYLHRARAEQGEVPAENYYLAAGDAGSLVNVAGVGILDTADSREPADRFVEFLLSEEAQAYFASETFEYPLVDGAETSGDLPPLSELQPPEIDLGDLSDLEGTLDLLRDTGVLP
jgi:iron(III) transport system substrate-binding protein